MLLNLHFKITVDNNGKENNLRIEAERTQNVLQILTALRLAENTLKETVKNYNGNKQLEELTLEDIYNVDKNN